VAGRPVPDAVDAAYELSARVPRLRDVPPRTGMRAVQDERPSRAWRLHGSRRGLRLRLLAPGVRALPGAAPARRSLLVSHARGAGTAVRSRRARLRARPRTRVARTRRARLSPRAERAGAGETEPGLRNRQGDLARGAPRPPFAGGVHAAALRYEHGRLAGVPAATAPVRRGRVAAGRSGPIPDAGAAVAVRATRVS
jgi:hypothetical protein